MKNKKGYEWLIVATYVVLALVCVYLNIFYGLRGAGFLNRFANILVNLAMFAIVGLVFARCFRKGFFPLNSMTDDLDRITEKIRKDAMNSHQFLWERYKGEKNSLFSDKVLQEQFLDYTHEMERVEKTDKTYYKCDIEDFINYDLIDTVIHRNQMNQVAGAMTGLGILGTFIGLSLGLQSFNTGTTAEITNSIEPLMEGIKVAFHTSIYGMIFSLIFNYVFKRKLDDAEASVRDFVNAYKKYVSPDTTTDGINRLMELQQEQTQAVRSMSDSIGHQLASGLAELLSTEFDKFDKTITDYSNFATRSQLDSLNVVVNAFIQEMNRSLDGSFTKLSNTIDKTYLTQEANARQMQEILSHTGNAAQNLAEMDRQTTAVMRALAQYADEVRGIQAEMGSTVTQLRQQTDAGVLLIEQEQKYLKDMEQYRKSLDASADAFEKKLAEHKALLDDIRSTVVEMPHRVDETFKIIDENLIDVESHFRDTILEIKDVTDKVPAVVEDAYTGMDKALNRAAEAIEDLSVTVEAIAQDGGSSRRSRR